MYVHVSDPAMQTIKCTVVGDLDAKVAELLRCFTTSTYATETMPTVSSCNNTAQNVEGC